MSRAKRTTGEAWNQPVRLVPFLVVLLITAVTFSQTAEAANNVTKTVLSQTQNPVEGATVRVYNNQNQEVRAGTTNAQGTVEFAPLGLNDCYYATAVSGIFTGTSVTFTGSDKTVPPIKLQPPPASPQGSTGLCSVGGFTQPLRAEGDSLRSSSSSPTGNGTNLIAGIGVLTTASVIAGAGAWYVRRRRSPA